MSLSQLVCPVIWDVDVQFPNEDWVSSLLPEQYKPSVSLRPTRAHMYRSLRGVRMCYRKACTTAGSAGPDSHPYCPTHIASVITPTTTPRVSFGKENSTKREEDSPTGARAIPGPILLTQIVQLRSSGFSSSSAIVEELTNRFGCELLDNAFRAYDLTHDSDVEAESMANRLQDIDVPMRSPLPHSHPTASAHPTTPDMTNPTTPDNRPIPLMDLWRKG